MWHGHCTDFLSVAFSSNHQGATPLVLAKRRGVNKDVIRLLESLEEQEVKGFNRGAHSKLETMQTAESERYGGPADQQPRAPLCSGAELFP